VSYEYSDIKEKKAIEKVTMETSCTQKQLGGGCLMYRRITCERALEPINAAEGWLFTRITSQYKLRKNLRYSRLDSIRIDLNNGYRDRSIKMTLRMQLHQSSAKLLPLCKSLANKAKLCGCIAMGFWT
jgi:hypothetical protein